MGQKWKNEEKKECARAAGGYNKAPKKILISVAIPVHRELLSGHAK